MDFDDFDLLDDWSETGDGDASDTWDEADEHFGYGPAGTAATWEDEEDWDGAAELDAGDVLGGGAAEREPVAMSLSAGDFGTAAAVAGWLLDQQADRIAAVILRQAPPASAPAADAHATQPWRRLTGPRLDTRAAPLAPGDILERSRLAATLHRRLAAGQQLGLEARPRAVAVPRSPDPSLQLQEALFTVVLSDLTPSAPVWVMFEERAGGFSTARLQPVFDGEGPAGRAYCFVDSADAAVHVIEWGLERYGLALPDFTWSGGF